MSEKSHSSRKNQSNPRSPKSRAARIMANQAEYQANGGSARGKKHHVVGYFD